MDDSKPQSDTTENASPKPIQVGPFTVRPYVPFDMVVLRKLDSPLIRQMREMSKPEADRKPTHFDDEEEFVLIYQFITPLPEVRKLIAKGPDVFREKAFERIGCNPQINPLLCAQLIKAVSETFLRAFSSLAANTEGSGAS